MTLKNLIYKEPVIRKYADKWFVEYYFRCPIELMRYGFKEWQRFKVYEDINRYKGFEKEKFAVELCQAVLIALRDEEHDPFKDIKARIEKYQNETELSIEKRITIHEAMIMYLQAAAKRKVRKNSMDRYKNFITILTQYLTRKELLNTDINEIQVEILNNFLEENETSREWSETTFMNYRNDINTFFNWCQAAKVSKIKPELNLLDTRVARATKNEFYKGVIRKKVTDELSKHPDLERFCKYVYFTCMRNQSELQKIKLKHIDLENRLITVPADISKEAHRYVPISNELYDILFPLNLHEYPHEFYLCSYNCLPGEKEMSENYFTRAYKVKIKEVLGLGPEFSIYGWKHTRVMELKKAGYSDMIIQQVTGHLDSDSFNHYTRGLGSNIDASIQGKTVDF